MPAKPDAATADDPDAPLPFRIVQTDEEYRRRTRRDERQGRLMVGTAVVIAVPLFAAIGYVAYELDSSWIGL